MADVSLAVIARDEEAVIERCLASARALVRESVVVDTGSRDRTASLAEECGARVVSAVWTGDFSAARNRSLAEAAGDWVLVLDADEELDAGAIPSIEGAVSSTPAWGFQLRERNLSPPGELVEYEDAFVTRLFRRRPGVVYEGAIHEQVTPSILRAGGTVLRLDAMIVHHGYARPVAQGESRATRNATALRELARERPLDPYIYFQLGCAERAAGDSKAAESALVRARELDLGLLSAEVRAALCVRLAQLALGRRDDARAAALAEQGLALDPEGTTALHVLAVAKAGLGDVAASLSAFRDLRTRANVRGAYREQIDRMIAALSASRERG